MGIGFAPATGSVLTMAPADGAAAAARAAAARVVTEVARQRRYLDEALAQVLAQGDGDSIRPLVQEVAYGTLRWYHALDAIATQLLREPLKSRDADVHALLLGGLYQLRHMRTAPHAAVDETVRAARILGKDWARGLLNACLRSYLRQRDSLEATIARSTAARLSHPVWLLAALQAAYPERWESIAAANNERPPMTLRVNGARVSRDDYLARLAGRGVGALPTTLAPSGIVLQAPLPVDQLPGFAEGLVSVQDEAAQLAAPLLDVQAGQRVLDLCAAPGGKTAHLLESVPDAGEVVAVDVDAERLTRLHQNLQRLGLKARVVCGDATEPCAWWDQQGFDRILLDAPCSATGVIRRHPDIKLRRQPEDLAMLAATQGHMLARVWPLLNRGGKLLYVTCSVLPVENEQPIERFLSAHTDAEALPLALSAGVARGPGRQLLPDGDRTDGFYYACIAKRA
jgi:16S rRNA (cytosine967-C5)-methyltransferase